MGSKELVKGGVRDCHLDPVIRIWLVTTHAGWAEVSAARLLNPEELAQSEAAEMVVEDLYFLCRVRLGEGAYLAARFDTGKRVIVKIRRVPVMNAMYSMVMLVSLGMVVSVVMLFTLVTGRSSEGCTGVTVSPVVVVMVVSQSMAPVTQVVRVGSGERLPTKT